MKESALLKIALICSLIGLFVLYFISAKIEVMNYKPAEFNKNAGEDVKLEGTIAKINGNGNAVFIDLINENHITIVLFTKDNINLKSGDKVEVIGKVQEYNGKNEIVAQKVRVVN